MSRPRKTAEEKQREEIPRRSMRALRAALGKSRPQFARLIGVSPDIMMHREHGRAPWRAEEISRAKKAVRAHLSIIVSALETLPD